VTQEKFSKNGPRHSTSFTREKQSGVCTQERLHPEVAIIFGAAARYCRAAASSSHDNAHPDIQHFIRLLAPLTGFVKSLFFISPRKGNGS
jgi:hypothetical protein